MGTRTRRPGISGQALAAISPTIPVLHLYAQPDDADLLSFQQAYADGHTWFQVHKLAARSQFPMFEVPEEMASAIIRFTATGSAQHAEKLAGDCRFSTCLDRLTRKDLRE